MAKLRLKFGTQFSLHRPNHAFDVEIRLFQTFAPQPLRGLALKPLLLDVAWCRVSSATTSLRRQVPPIGSFKDIFVATKEPEAAD
jgi:hypothetical protein